MSWDARKTDCSVVEKAEETVHGGTSFRTESSWGMLQKKSRGVECMIVHGVQRGGEEVAFGEELSLFVPDGAWYTNDRDGDVIGVVMVPSEPVANYRAGGTFSLSDEGNGCKLTLKVTDGGKEDTDFDQVSRQILQMERLDHTEILYRDQDVLVARGYMPISLGIGVNFGSNSSRNDFTLHVYLGLVKTHRAMYSLTGGTSQDFQDPVEDAMLRSVRVGKQGKPAQEAEEPKEAAELSEAPRAETVEERIDRMIARGGGTSQAGADQFSGKEGEADAETQEDADGESEASEFPCADPEAWQYTHYSFLGTTSARLGALGGMIRINQTGTEMEFEAVSGMQYSDDPAVRLMLARLSGKEISPFPLADHALKMGELFRVSPEVFHPGHDREQEIVHGMIQRCETYNAFRSFAWTLAAYCDSRGYASSGSVDFETLKGIAHFVKVRGNLNYRENEKYCPALTRGDDLHNYFLPDDVIRECGAELKRLLEKEVDPNVRPFGVISLEGLRRDLTWLRPAMETIYRKLAGVRDWDEILQGKIEDMLYAWCSMTYAAREPFFMEDGPMNCLFDHPDIVPEWELEFRRMREQRRKEWLEKYDHLIDRDCRIIIPGKKFVFTGVDREDADWLRMMEVFTARGGIVRSSVSGQTDYVVCDPENAGDSALRKMQEMRLQGRCKETKVILFERFRSALGFEKKEEAPEKKAGQPATAPVVPEENGENAKEALSAPVTFTYAQKQTVRGKGYSMEIPDGFTIEKDTEGRDFVAWLPDASSPDRESSGFVILAGEQNDLSQFDFRTEEEFFGLFRLYDQMLMSSELMSSLFEDSGYSTYSRDDLLAAVFLRYAGDIVHANCVCGGNSMTQMIRFQISGVERKDREAYVGIIRHMLDHFHAEEPVQLMEQPDDPKFQNMTEKTFPDWKECVDKRSEHYCLIRAIRINMLTEGFKKKPFHTPQEFENLKRDVRALLKDTSQAFEKMLTRCEHLYLNVQGKDPHSPVLGQMYETLKEVARLTEQEVTFDGGENGKVNVRSAYAADFSKRIKCGQTGGKDVKPAGKSGHQTDQIRQAEKNIQEIGRFLQDIREKIQTAEEKLERKKRLEDEIQSVQSSYASDLNKHKQAIEQAKAEITKVRDEIRSEESVLGSLGFFAMKNKAECRKKIKGLQGRLPGLDSEIQEAGKKLNRKEKEIQARIRRIKGDEIEELDADQWTQYHKALTELGQSMDRDTKKYEDMRKQILDGSDTLNVEAWKKPALPPEPPATRKFMTQTLEDIIYDVLLLMDRPCTITAIHDADPRLEKYTTMKIAAVVRQMGDKLKKEIINRTACFSLNE